MSKTAIRSAAGTKPALLVSVTDSTKSMIRARLCVSPQEGNGSARTSATPSARQTIDVAAIVEEYGQWLSRSRGPKLFINAEPGAILIGKQREFARSLPNQTEVTVAGSHFIQEDSPDEIAAAISDWLNTL